MDIGIGVRRRLVRKSYRYQHINLTPIALDAIDPPVEKIPEPIWITITQEEKERMFRKPEYITKIP